MLANILRDMYVDPALLAELDDDQKNVLFCKMREEQIRRWKQREESERKHIEQPKSKTGSKKVVFLLGDDGKPWTWVMGEDEAVKETNGLQSKNHILTSENVNEFLANDRRGPLRPTSLPIKPDHQNENKDNKERSFNNRIINDKNAINTSVSKGNLIVTNGKLKTSPDHSPIKQALPHSPIQINVNESSNKPIVEVKPMILTNKKNTKEIVDFRITNSEPLPQDLEEKLQSLVCDVPCSPVQPDKQRWLQEKQEQRKARDSYSTSPLTPPDSPPRHEIFRSSLSNNNNLTVNDERKSLSSNQDWNSIDEQAWLEQEKRAKEADAQRRLSARNAREEIKRSSKIVTESESIYACFDARPVPMEVVDESNAKGTTELPEPENNSKIPTTEPHKATKEVSIPMKPAILPKPSMKPIVPNRQSRTNVPMQATSRSKDAKVFERAEVESWFAESQLNRGAVSENGLAGDAVTWFHGFLPRCDAETKLSTLNEGSFLVRVHDRIKGYVVSFKASDKVKHFLVDASQPDQVQFFGANQIVFKNIVHLVHFHMTQPVSVAGNELLKEGIPLIKGLSSIPSAIRL